MSGRCPLIVFHQCNNAPFNPFKKPSPCPPPPNPPTPAPPPPPHTHMKYLPDTHSVKSSPQATWWTGRPSKLSTLFGALYAAVSPWPSCPQMCTTPWGFCNEVTDRYKLNLEQLCTQDVVWGYAKTLCNSEMELYFNWKAAGVAITSEFCSYCSCYKVCLCMWVNLRKTNAVQMTHIKICQFFLFYSL